MIVQYFKKVILKALSARTPTTPLAHREAEELGG